jgi:2-polyprenyl-6-methoxyphenol hydroxylase-like FAD-dependent oxidoreductase
MPDRLRVAVAGGGIGGLVLGVALRRAGADPVVFERAEDLRRVQVGGAIHLWANGTRALAAAGLYDVVRASVDDDAVMERQQFLTDRGRLLHEWDVSVERHGMPTLGLMRGELHAVLAEEAGGMVRLGAPVTGFEQDQSGVTVRYGTEEARFDVLIGADGLYSRIRELIVGDGPPDYAGYTAWIGSAFCDHPATRNTVLVCFGAGGRFVAWSVSGKRVAWEAIAAESEGGRDPEGARAAVLERFGDWAAPVTAIVGASRAEDVHRSDAYARKAASRWGEARVTMIGDAAHAMTNAVGQGANQAVEDAIVLVRCLERVPDPVAALREYERLRRKRAETFITRSRALAKMALVRGPLQVSGRNMFMRVMGGVAYRQVSAEMAYDAGAA